MPRLAEWDFSHAVQIRPAWMRAAWEWAGTWGYICDAFQTNCPLRLPFDRILTKAEPLLAREPTHFIHGDYAATAVSTGHTRPTFSHAPRAEKGVTAPEKQR